MAKTEDEKVNENLPTFDNPKGGKADVGEAYKLFDFLKGVFNDLKNFLKNTFKPIKEKLDKFFKKKESDFALSDDMDDFKDKETQVKDTEVNKTTVVEKANEAAVDKATGTEVQPILKGNIIEVKLGGGSIGADEIIKVIKGAQEALNNGVDLKDLTVKFTNPNNNIDYKYKITEASLNQIKDAKIGENFGSISDSKGNPINLETSKIIQLAPVNLIMTDINRINATTISGNKYINISETHNKDNPVNLVEGINFTQQVRNVEDTRVHDFQKLNNHNIIINGDKITQGQEKATPPFLKGIISNHDDKGNVAKDIIQKHDHPENQQTTSNSKGGVRS